MSKPAIDLNGSKELIGSIFEMTVSKITEKIRMESPDDKDKLILKHEAEIQRLKDENSKIRSRLDDIKNITNRNL